VRYREATQLGGTGARFQTWPQGFLVSFTSMLPSFCRVKPTTEHNKVCTASAVRFECCDPFGFQGYHLALCYVSLGRDRLKRAFLPSFLLVLMVLGMAISSALFHC
jgi:hypothetical protein